ncbi:hypothetical protein ACTWQF_18095 [Streptomyces sp. 8N114]
MAGEAETGEEAHDAAEAWEAQDEVKSGSRFLAALALTAVVVVVAMLCVPLKEEGAHDGSPSCGPTIAPEDPYVHSIEFNTRHIRQLGYSGLDLAGGLAVASPVSWSASNDAHRSGPPPVVKGRMCD